MNTIYLTDPGWDMTLDAAQNIAMASDPYSQAQDAASEIMTFLGECYYDTAKGIPYFQQLLGKGIPIDFARTQFQAAAELTPGVVSAQVFFSALINRQLSGQVQITTNDGQTAAIGF